MEPLRHCRLAALEASLHDVIMSTPEKVERVNIVANLDGFVTRVHNVGKIIIDVFCEHPRY